MENSGSSNQQVSSPQSRRTGKTAVVSSPWNQIVRGESESNSVEPPSLSPPAVSSPPVVSDQRQVWNVPSNGAVEVGPVMGAVSWPALPHSRADGSYNHNYYGARRDQDRGNQEWNAHRNFNGRDGHMQPQRVSPRFMRHQPPPPPPPASTPFLTAPPVRPFGSPMPFAGMCVCAWFSCYYWL
ncbi:La-related protein 1C [Linum perenne]